MNFEKVIYEKIAVKSIELKYKPDSIAGVWVISNDKKRESYGVNSKNTDYLLIFNEDEITGFALFYNFTNGKIIQKVPLNIKRIGKGTYELHIKKVKRIFKISYSSYDGNMCLFFEDSTPYNERGNYSYDALLSSRDYSDKTIEQIIESYVEDFNRDSMGP